MTLGNMSVGDERYTLPWAMWVDSNAKGWLDSSYPAEANPHGTFQMLVTRTGEGYIVYPPRHEAHKPSNRSPNCATWLPVVRIV